MSYKGQLQRGVPFTIDFGGDPAGPSALTIIKINQRGGSHASPTTIGVAATGTLNELLGDRIVRMVIRVNVYPGARVVLRVLQGSSQFTDSVEADTDLVWDTVA